MNLNRTFLLACFLLIADFAYAGQWDLDVSGHAQGLYGNINSPHRFDSLNKKNKGVGEADISFTAGYEIKNDYYISFNLDINGGADKELKNYNQGAWGEEAYVIADSPYGRLMLGQTFNVDAQFHEGTPSAGVLSSNDDVVDFITNPNWKRNGKTTKFATLNTTYINTDGVAPKISYISPEVYSSVLGFSYVPDAYNRRGLINKFADYKKDDGYIASLYNYQDFAFAEMKTTVGYAEFHDDDKEYTASIQFSKGNWSLGGGYRKTDVDGEQNYKTPITAQTPEFFDGYREAEAWNIGIGYKFGPFKSALTYFESKAKHTESQDKIITFANQYQLDKYVELYFAAAHVDFEGQKGLTEDDNQGYALIIGAGFNF